MWSYQPDLDERTPNILLSGSANVVPTSAGGFRPTLSAPAANAAAGQPQYPVLAAAPVGARYLLRDDGSDRLFAGTATKIYEANQAVAYAWTDVTRVAGNYSGVLQWMFDQYGATSLAAASLGTRTEIQASTGVVGTVFANLTNAPKARIIVVQDNAIYAFDYDSTGTAVPDGWIRSDTGGITTWTPNTAECVSGRFTETPGNITAAIKHGNGVVVFKDRGMWRGQYVGLPEVVRWELVTESVGCFGPLCVVCVDDLLYFADANGVWVYDGSRPKPVDDGIRVNIGGVWAGTGSTPNGIQIGVDDKSHTLTFHFIGAGIPGATYHTFHYRTGAWGPQCTQRIVSASSTFDVCCVCNGPYDKLYAMPGMPGISLRANAARFVGSGDLKSFHSYVIDADSASVSKAHTIVPSLFGDDHKGGNVTALYHDFRAYSVSVTGTGVVAVGDTLAAYRRPFSRGTPQSSQTGTYSDSLGYTSIRANGHWFKDALSFTVTSAAVDDTHTMEFEWVGFRPEYGNGGPKS